jgi:hypothetical protein
MPASELPYGSSQCCLTRSAPVVLSIHSGSILRLDPDQVRVAEPLAPVELEVRVSSGCVVEVRPRAPFAGDRFHLEIPIDWVGPEDTDKATAIDHG